MEVDLEVSKSVGNVNIISEKAMLIHKPSTSLVDQEPISKSYDPSYEAPIHSHDQVFLRRTYSGSDMFQSGRSLDSESMFTASGETDPGGSYAEGYAGSVQMHNVKSYGAVGVSSQNGETSLLILSEFDPFPVTITCSKCQKKVETKLKYKPGKVTYLWSVALTPLLCCFLPCCVSLAKDVHHTCPECGTMLGVYKRNCCGGHS